MKKYTFTILITIVLLFTSCLKLPVPDLSFDFFYRIENSRIRLVEKISRDTICRTTYDIHNNLEGDTCSLINEIYSVKKRDFFGVAIKYNVIRVAAENGSPYGPFPNLGNIDSVSKIRIEAYSNKAYTC